MRKLYCGTRANRKIFAVLVRFTFSICWRSLAIVFLLCFSMQFTNAQVITQRAAVKANFGIDADLYTGYSLNLDPGLIAFPYADAFGSDDWFEKAGLGTGGLPVFKPTQHFIDSINSIYENNNQIAFTIRMSDFNNVPRNTKKVIYGTSDSIIWIDGVYARDWNSAQGNKDATSFIGNSSKNFDNPSTWDIGEGSPWQKGDLIDVYGHMRQDRNGDIYGMGAFTTRSDDGVVHADFEFFREEFELTGSGFPEVGPDGGRNAWSFNSDGSVDMAGTLIVSIDFEKGGGDPQASVRVWVSDTAMAFVNASSNPSFLFTGDFDNGGDDAAGYGYYEIEPATEGGDPSAWATVNVDSITPATPWGTQEGEKAEWDSIMKPLQFAEFAINLSYLGLDAFGGDACNKSLGTLLVKTRSSHSFDSELYDLVGPLPFGYDLETNVAVQNLFECLNAADPYIVDLTEGLVDAFDGVATYYTSKASTADLGNAIINPASFAIPADSMPATIWVRSSNTDDENCYAIDSFVIGFYGNPECSIDGYSEDVSYVGANDGWINASEVTGTENALFNWWTFDGTIPSGMEHNENLTDLGPGTYYLSITDTATGCVGDTCEATIGQASLPTCELIPTNLTCHNDGSGAITAEVGGGDGEPYYYIWVEGASFNGTLGDTITEGQDIPSISGLSAGWYTLFVKDTVVQVLSGECVVELTEPDTVILTCPNDTLVSACLSEAQIMTAFDEWMARVLVTGSDSLLTTDWDSITYPDQCGDTVTVEWTLHDQCANPNTCQATFRLPAPSDVTYNEPSDADLDACNFADQTDLDTTFANWVAAQTVAIDVDGGCDPDIDDNSDQITLNNFCVGDTVTVTWTITDLCFSTSVSADFMVSAAPAVTWNEPSDSVNAACMFPDQASLDQAFADWIAYVETVADVSGGCDPIVTPDNVEAPNYCIDDTVTVTWTIEDLCETQYFDAKFIVHGDYEKPVITLPLDYPDYVCNDAVPATLTATWADNCLGNGSVDATPVLTGSTLCEEIYTYRFIVSDSCGNTAMDSLTVVREWESLEDCETSFARLNEDLPLSPEFNYVPKTKTDPYAGTDYIGARCFLEDGFERWGWVNRIRVDSTYYLAVYAGAGQCDYMNKGDSVGVAILEFYGNSLKITFDLIDPWVATEVHVNVSDDMYPTMENGKNKGEPTVAPGKYTVVYEKDAPITGFTVEVDGLDDDGYAYVIVHAVTCRPLCYCDETLYTDLALGTYSLTPVRGKDKSAVTTDIADFKVGELKVFPNPFTEKVTFEFVSATDSYGTLDIYSVTGQHVARILDRMVQSGELNRVNYEPGHDVSGVYIYRLKLDDNVQVGRIIYKE